MKIRKYVARSMPEALQQVRDDLGENAVILNTRQVRRNSRFGPQEEARVEVTAAFDESAPAPPAAAEVSSTLVAAPASIGGPRPTAGSALANGLESTAVAPSLRRAPSALPAAPTATGAAPNADLQQMARGLRQLQESMARLERRSATAVPLPESLARLADRLRGIGMASDLVDTTVQSLLVELDGATLADREAIADRTASLLAEQLPPWRDLRMGSRRRVVGFFGAAGAGKTTAAAKIAAGFCLKRGGRVLMITADDRRVGALEQARAYGQILGVPLEAAYDEREMSVALARHPQVRLVLVDLAGCGPREQRELDRQRQLLAAAEVEEVHVVLDGTSSLEHMLDQIEAVESFPDRRLLFTKMDQALRPGPAVSAAIRSQVPTSYLAVGSAVPGELEAGDLAALVARVIGAQPADRKGR